MKKSLTITTLAAGLAVSASAQLFTDDFNYSNGDLTTVSSSTWTAHSGAGSVPVQVSEGAAVLAHGSGSREDVGVTFATVSSGILSATFDLSVTDDPFGSGTDFEYFAHFQNDGSFDFTSRLDIQAPTADGDYTLGISSISSTAEQTYATDFDFGEVYTVEITYDFGSGLASLTVDSGTTITSAVDAERATLNRFSLRQSASSNNETITIDNLTIVPEPSSYALLAGFLALISVMVRRRS